MVREPASCMLLHASAPAFTGLNLWGPLCCMHPRAIVCCSLQSSFMAAWLHLVAVVQPSCRVALAALKPSVAAQCRHPAESRQVAPLWPHTAASDTLLQFSGGRRLICT